ncbi:MAG: PEP-CTERM sorting domain-containing protein [Acidobacteria bacterium]|nr:PEP-CTERM sorting domain-containing protein [Acidobacteriota bacterium]
MNRTAIWTASFFLFSLSSLHGATITAQYITRFTDGFVTVSPNGGASTEQTRISTFINQRVGGTYVGPPDFPTIFNSYCIELQESTSLGTTATFDVVALEMANTFVGGIGGVKADLIRELLGRYSPNLNVLPGAAVVGGVLRSGSTIAGALQLAIWEIESDAGGTFDLAGGSFRLISADDPVVGATAMAMLSSLNGSGPIVHDLYALTRVGGQDLLIQSSNPEPGTMGLMLTGIGVIFWVRRKQRRDTARPAIKTL